MITKIRNIAISGETGSGTTTLAKNLQKALNFKYINAGDFFRKWHIDNNIPLEESQKVPEELDRKIDGQFQKKMREGKEIIFESRLSGWLARDLKNVYKILCIADFDTAMARVAKRDKISTKEAKKLNKIRSLSHREKFKRLYGVDDYLDKKYFDIVIDTTNMSQEKVVAIVMNYLR